MRNESLLARGARGPDVKDLQEVLKGMGAYVGAIDGIYGPLTEAAVRAFQRATGVHGVSLKVDGIYGPNTRAALSSVLDGKTLPTAARGVLGPARPQQGQGGGEQGQGGGGEKDLFPGANGPATGAETESSLGGFVTKIWLVGGAALFYFFTK